MSNDLILVNTTEESLVPGKFNNAILLNPNKGQYAHLSVEAEKKMNSRSQLTVSFWCKVIGPTQGELIYLQSMPSGSFNEPGVSIFSDARTNKTVFDFVPSPDRGATKVTAEFDLVPHDEWVYIAFTYDNDDYHMYFGVSGGELMTKTFHSHSSAFLANNGERITFAQDSLGEYKDQGNAIIYDDIALWSGTALSPEGIRAIFSSERPVDGRTDMTYYFDLDSI